MLNLTEFEQRALDAPINLADGHPRQELSPTQSAIVERFPELFAAAAAEPFDRLEQRVQTSFLTHLGQSPAVVDTGQVLTTYSSSVAMMVLGRYLRRFGHTVGLIHPTFDNLPDLLRQEVTLVPVPEPPLDEAGLDELRRAGVTCLLLTTPNNPTGWRLEEAALERLATWAARWGVLLAFDTSFRGFDSRAQYDMYGILEQAGVDFAVIEDTGKLWPVAELKLGFIVVSAGLTQPVRRIMSDVLLSVSPFVLRVVEALVEDYAGGGAAQLHQLIAANRARVAATVAGLDGVHLLDPDARVSVCRLRFASPDDCQRIRAGLERWGVHVLPGAQFYWAEPDAGASDLRIALARDRSAVVEAMARLERLCHEPDYAHPLPG